ncbi:HAD family phosphatase [Candidatus Roizmanbacteria bacterium]|nr:HAD family phosphatase [Candidatus Roizmanbacteria bacterium]
MKVKTPKAFIFDFDGVLTRAEKKYSANLMAWIEEAKRYGVSMDVRVFYINEGSAHKVAEALIKRYHLKGVSEEQLVREKTEIASNLVNRTPNKLYPQVENILRYLHSKNIKLAIATGADRNTVEKSIPPDLFELFDYDATVTADDKIDGRKIKGKPDPEQYQIAVARLSEKFHLDPSDCWVVENSPLGIQAAKAAGLYCLALMTTLSRATLKRAGADKVFANNGTFYRYLPNII